MHSHSLGQVTDLDIFFVGFLLDIVRLLLRQLQFLFEQRIKFLKLIEPPDVALFLLPLLLHT
jgi:hypothetical protein